MFLLIFKMSDIFLQPIIVVKYTVFRQWSWISRNWISAEIPRFSTRNYRFLWGKIDILQNQKRNCLTWFAKISNATNLVRNRQNCLWTSSGAIFSIYAVLTRTANGRSPLHFFPLLPPGLAARMMLRRSGFRQIRFKRCKSAQNS